AAGSLFAVVNLVLIVPVYLGAPAHETGSKTFRAVFLNVSTPNRAHDKVISFIGSTGADFIVIAEVNDLWIRKLRSGLEDYTFCRQSPREDNFGIALMSRFLIEDGGIVTIGETAVPSVMVRLKVDGIMLTVIGVHTMPPKGRLHAQRRDRQIEELAKIVSERDGPVMVLGDLNMTSWSPRFVDLLAGTGLKDSRQGFGLQVSWPRRMPLLWIPIDHCLVSPDIVVHDRWVSPAVGSDHYPIVIDFSV
ncbi:unnamed protein product, partial [marine sediment metagenome]